MRALCLNQIGRSMHAGIYHKRQTLLNADPTYKSEWTIARARLQGEL